jgi:signal transduction histidine kinase
LPARLPDLAALATATWLAAVLLPVSPVLCEAHRSILVLEQSDVRGPFYSSIFATLRAKVNEAATPATLYVENLDLSRFHGPGYDEALRSFLSVKYRDNPVGLVLAMGSASLDYALTWREHLWPGTPVVFAFVDEIAAGEIPPGVTGIMTRLRLEDMVAAARSVVPGLRRVALVGDRLEEQPVFAHFREALPAVAETLQVIDLTGMSMAALKTRVATLPPDSAILYTAVYSDGAGTYFPPSTALEMIAAAANRPIVAPIETYIGRGAIGGYVALPEMIGREAAELALRVLDGADPSSIPVAVGNSLRPVFDLRLLERWSVDQARLPRGSEIRYRQAKVWEQYPRQTVIAIIVVLLQSLLVAALLVEHRRRRRAEIDVRSRMEEIAHLNRLATAGELSAQIAHEVNQPLGAILSNTETAELLLDASEPDVAEVKEILADIRRDDLRASEVIVRLRRFLKKTPAETREVNLNDILRDVLGFVSAQASARGVALEERLETAPLVVHGDPVQLQQIVVNLVSNAIDAVSRKPEGQRTVTGRTRRTSDKEAEISISDSGPGIDPAALPRLFERFYTTKEHGMGMGLPIAQTIAQAHGGEVRAENRPEGGAVFRLTLPLAEREGVG